MNIRTVEIYKYNNLETFAQPKQWVFPVEPDAFIAFGNQELLSSYFGNLESFHNQRLAIQPRFTHFDPEIPWSLYVNRFSPTIPDQDNLMFLLPPGNRFNLNQVYWVEQMNFGLYTVSYSDNREPLRRIEGDCQLIDVKPQGNKIPSRISFTGDGCSWLISAQPVGW